MVKLVPIKLLVSLPQYPAPDTEQLSGSVLKMYRLCFSLVRLIGSRGEGLALALALALVLVLVLVSFLVCKTVTRAASMEEEGRKAPRFHFAEVRVHA